MATGSIPPGKCSPDGVFREYKYTCEIAAAVVKHLGYQGFDAALVTPEEYDVSLRARTERVNTWCQTAGDRLADCLYQAAALWLPGHKLRKDYSDDGLFLESDEGRRAIVALHVEGIVNYVLKR